MFYINIDLNRFQVSASENPANGQIQVDCITPSLNHKLKQNYQEFSGEEQWELAEEKQAIENIKAELTAIYDEVQDEYLKAQFEPARNAFLKHFDNGDMDRALAILQSPYIPAEVQPIAQSIYNKYLELTS